MLLALFQCHPSVPLSLKSFLASKKCRKVARGWLGVNMGQLRFFQIGYFMICQWYLTISRGEKIFFWVRIAKSVPSSKHPEIVTFVTWNLVSSLIFRDQNQMLKHHQYPSVTCCLFPPSLYKNLKSSQSGPTWWWLFSQLHFHHPIYCEISSDFSAFSYDFSWLFYSFPKSIGFPTAPGVSVGTARLASWRDLPWNPSAAVLKAFQVARPSQQPPNENCWRLRLWTQVVGCCGRFQILHLLELTW